MREKSGREMEVKVFDIVNQLSYFNNQLPVHWLLRTETSSSVLRMERWMNGGMDGRMDR